VPALHTEVLNHGPACFGDPQSVEGQQAAHCVGGGLRSEMARDRESSVRVSPLVVDSWDTRGSRTRRACGLAIAPSSSR
jgi:hypothetical protein